MTETNRGPLSSENGSSQIRVTSPDVVHVKESMGKDKFMYLKNKVLTGNENINDNIRVENTALYKVKSSMRQTKSDLRNSKKPSPNIDGLIAQKSSKVEITNF